MPFWICICTDIVYRNRSLARCTDKRTKRCCLKLERLFLFLLIAEGVCVGMFAMRNDCRLTDCHGDRRFPSSESAALVRSIDAAQRQDGCAKIKPGVGHLFHCQRSIFVKRRRVRKAPSKTQKKQMERRKMEKNKLELQPPLGNHISSRNDSNATFIQTNRAFIYWGLF